MTDEPKTWPQTPCESCGKPMIWANTAKGLLMPVDPEPPESGGNIILEDRHGVYPFARVLTVVQQFGLKNLRTSHFATCPFSSSHRKKKAENAARRRLT